MRSEIKLNLSPGNMFEKSKIYFPKNFICFTCKGEGVADFFVEIHLIETAKFFTICYFSYFGSHFQNNLNALGNIYRFSKERKTCGWKVLPA